MGALPKLPDNLSALTLDELSQLETDILAAVEELRATDPAELDDEALDQLEQAGDLLDQLRTARGEVEQAAAQRAERAQAAIARLSGDEPDEESEETDTAEDQPEGADEDTSDESQADAEKEPALTAGAKGTPRVRTLKKKTTTEPGPADEGAIVAAAGLVASGPNGLVKDMIEVGKLVDTRLGAYRSMRSGTARDGVVQFVKPAREKGLVFDTRQADSVEAGNRILAHAGDTSRLPQALTADVSAGWCAPSETVYDLCEVGGDVYGLLNLPTITVSRGGIRYAQGPDFSTIYAATTDWDWSEAEIKAGTGTPAAPLEKPCIEVPCPAFQEERLRVTGVCITGDILLERGYPEVVAQFTRGVMAAHAHKLNAAKIAEVVAAAGAAINLSTTPTVVDQGVTGFLAQLEVAAIDVRYRYRMSDATTLEAILPAWAKAHFRADLSRRTGVPFQDVTDAQINAWFAARNVAPQWVVDWQDAYSGLATGPGGTTPLVNLPKDVQFVMYAAGTFVAAETPVVSLDTVYDSAMLRVNKYTALFTEEAYLVAQRCPEAHLYQFTFCPAGLTGDSSLVCAA